MKAQPLNNTSPTTVLDAAIELLGAYQIQYALKEISLNQAANGDIEVWAVPAAGGTKIPYGRINKFTKRFTKFTNASA